MNQSPIVDLEIVSDERVGDGGWLALRRMRLRNVHADGARSREYLVDYALRPKGTDAVVVALYARDADGAVRVLLRSGLRPPVYFGREPADTPVPDGARSFFHLEVVAGVVEAHDRGEEGLRRRACDEALEEAGFAVAPADMEPLGAGSLLLPGVLPEKIHLFAARVDPATAVRPEGDGSPYEEGASLSWMELGAAITGCVTGVIQDAKSELILRRLADRLDTERTK